MPQSRGAEAELNHWEGIPEAFSQLLDFRYLDEQLLQLFLIDR